MNFFRKKNTAYISLETPDFGPDTQKLWSDLLYALEGHEVKQVTVRLYDSGDLSMRVLSVIAALGLKLKNETIGFDLEASPRLIQTIRKLNFSNVFSNVTEVS